jgi:hypothetical protein
VQLFTAGLPDLIRINVELLNPPDLNTTLATARAYERRSQSLPWGHLPAGEREPRPTPRPAATGTSVLEQLASSKLPQQSTQRFKRLTPTEMDERRKQGLCYNCDEQYFRGHPCQCPSEEEDPSTIEHVLSLHAFMGTWTEDTMQIVLSIHGHHLTALLDSGSTQFPRPSLIEATGHHYGTVTNGERVACKGFTEGMPVVIGHEHFAIPCYTIPLDSFDVILGVNFLRTLGPILWDFDDLCMAFWHGGRRVFWKGLGSPRNDIHEPATRSLQMADPQMMEQLLQSFESVFQEPQGLPPARHCDHKIHLKTGTRSVVVRPYRYPQL